MNTDKLILDFAKKKMGEILITDLAGNILYRNHMMSFTDVAWRDWAARDLPQGELDEEIEWEIHEGDEGDYRVHSVPVSQDGERLVMHHVYDVQDDFALIRELSAYTKERQLMARFQREMMERLSGRISDCLPIILRFLQVEQVVLCIERKICVEIYALHADTGEMKQYREVIVNQFDTPREEHIIVKTQAGEERDYLCYMSEKTMNNRRYAVYLPGEIDDEYDTFPMHYGVIRLFLENVLLREEAVYESEHDALTGLYNKGRYLSMMKEFLPSKERIAIYNMDVNYLKRLNDTLGHEAGDKLLIKAAQSLAPLVSERVAAFRIGGDEFLLIAWDLDEPEAKAIKVRWEKGLEQLNQADDGIECIIACGLVWGGPGHDLDAMLQEADEKMYQNKVEIKRARGDDPDAR